MKILDSSVLIGIFDDINRPDIFDDILKLGHELAITKYVLKELLAKPSNIYVQKLLKGDKLKLLEENSIEEIRAFQEQTYNLEDGETDVILTCLKFREYMDNIYCILDDKDARKATLELNIKRRGLWGLLDMLEERGIKSSDEVKEIKTLLKDSNFRTPKDLS